MIKLIINELKKVRISKIIFSLLLFIISLFIMNKYGKEDIYNLSYYLIPFIGIVISILFSGTICSEIENGTFKYYLTKPFKRWKIFISKYLSIIIYLVINIFIIIIFSCLIQNKFEVRYIINYILNCIPILFISSFIIYLSTKFKNQAFVSTVSILTLCFSLIVSQILFGIKFTIIEYTFLPYLDFSLFNDKTILNSINSELGISLSLEKAIIIDILSTIIFLVFGLIRFNKKDIKN